MPPSWPIFASCWVRIFWTDCATAAFAFAGNGFIFHSSRWICCVRYPGLSHSGPRSMSCKKIGSRSRNGTHDESFASVLQSGLGRTICRDFYFPYAEKIWGCKPEELSAVQARRRVRAGSLGKLCKKVLSAVPVNQASRKRTVLLSASGLWGDRPAVLRSGAGRGGEVSVWGRRRGYSAFTGRGRYGGVPHRAQGAHGSRGPRLVHHSDYGACPAAARPGASPAVLHASQQIHYRSMILIYLLLAQ